MISKKDIQHLAKLARIDLGIKEEEALAEDIESILAYVDRLTSVDVTSVKPTTHSEEALHNSVRSDVSLSEPEGVDLLRSQFPEEKDRYLKVKNVFDHEER